MPTVALEKGFRSLYNAGLVAGWVSSGSREINAGVLSNASGNMQRGFESLLRTGVDDIEMLVEPGRRVSGSQVLDDFFTTIANSAEEAGRRSVMGGKQTRFTDTYIGVSLADDAANGMALLRSKTGDTSWLAQENELRTWRDELMNLAGMTVRSLSHAG